MCASLWDMQSGTDPFSLPPTMAFLTQKILRLKAPLSRQDFKQSAQDLHSRSVASGLPVVFAAPAQYLRTVYYGGADSADFVYLSSRVNALSVVKFDTLDLGLMNLAPFAGLKVLPYEEFIRVHPHFLLVALAPDNGEYYSVWIQAKLREANALLTAEPSRPLLVDVHFP
jgi:hypothetical protein